MAGRTADEASVTRPVTHVGSGVERRRDSKRPQVGVDGERGPVPQLVGPTQEAVAFDVGVLGRDPETFRQLTQPVRQPGRVEPTGVDDDLDASVHRQAEAVLHLSHDRRGVPPVGIGRPHQRARVGRRFPQGLARPTVRAQLGLAVTARPYGESTPPIDSEAHAMTMTEDDRYHLHQQLEEALDERGANTMMELLPPVGWADVTTKRDLDQLEERMDLRFQNVDLRFDNVDSRLDEISENTSLRLNQAAETTNLRFDQAAESTNLRFDQAAESTNLRFDQAAESTNLRFNQAAESTNLRFEKVEKRIDAQADRIISKLLTILVPIIAVAVAFLTAMSVWGPG